ncbi:MAG: substrate-binding domain-containing protein, partial [Dermatophilaceae bacterium]
YVTDVIAAGADVDGAGIPDEQNVVAEYPIVVTTEAPNPRAGQAFVDFVLDDAGRSVLSDHGFVAP